MRTPRRRQEGLRSFQDDPEKGPGGPRLPKPREGARWLQMFLPPWVASKERKSSNGIVGAAQNSPKQSRAAQGSPKGPQEQSSSSPSGAMQPREVAQAAKNSPGQLQAAHGSPEQSKTARSNQGDPRTSPQYFGAALSSTAQNCPEQPKTD